MRFAQLSPALATLLVAAGGCVVTLSPEIGRPFDPAIVERISVCATTQADLEKKLGPTGAAGYVDGYKTVSWVYMQRVTNAMIRDGEAIKRQYLRVWFNADGQVVHFTYNSADSTWVPSDPCKERPAAPAPPAASSVPEAGAPSVPGTGIEI